MIDREKVIGGLEQMLIHYNEMIKFDGDAKNHVLLYHKAMVEDALAMLKEQDELLKHEYWRGYNNGRADERGLQEGTIMQTFSPD